MKRVLTVFVLIALLVGCGNTESCMNRAVSLRNALEKAEQCTFAVELTADYLDVIYTFSMKCRYKAPGSVFFEVTSPKSISGITGCISSDGGKFTFDEHALFFPTLSDGEISPISAPWLFIEILKSGYITGCGGVDNGFLISLMDSQAENALQAEVYMNEENVPIFTELYWKNRRVMTMHVEDFRIL